MIQKTNIKNFVKDVLNNTKYCVVKFKSEGCHLCHALEPVYEKIAKNYQNDFEFFVVDTDQNNKLSEMFADSGVPTLYIFGKTEAYEIPDPDKPHEQTWFTEEYIKDALHDFLKKENK
jgi:thioredoxin-like negative regulator of GroEL